MSKTEEFPLIIAPQVYPTIRQSWSIAGIVILMALAFSPMVLLKHWIGDEAAALAYYLSAFGTSFYVLHQTRRRRQGSSGYDLRIASWRLLPPLFLGTVGLLFGVVSPIASLIPMPESIKAVLRSTVGDTGPFTFVCFVVAAPVLEELIFRGIMLDGLLRRYGPLKSILVSSFLFGLVHLNPWQFVTGSVLGCFLGWVYYRSGSVGPCIVIHMSANASGYLMRLAIDPESIGAEPGGLLGPFGGSVPLFAAFHATMLTVAAISIHLLRREFARNLYIPVISIVASEPSG